MPTHSCISDVPIVVKTRRSYLRGSLQAYVVLFAPSRACFLQAKGLQFDPNEANTHKIWMKMLHSALESTMVLKYIRTVVRLPITTYIVRN